MSYLIFLDSNLTGNQQLSHEDFFNFKMFSHSTLVIQYPLQHERRNNKIRNPFFGGCGEGGGIASSSLTSSRWLRSPWKLWPAKRCGVFSLTVWRVLPVETAIEVSTHTERKIKWEPEKCITRYNTSAHAEDVFFKKNVFKCSTPCQVSV